MKTHGCGKTISCLFLLWMVFVQPLSSSDAMALESGDVRSSILCWASGFANITSSVDAAEAEKRATQQALALIREAAEHYLDTNKEVFSKHGVQVRLLEQGPGEMVRVLHKETIESPVTGVQCKGVRLAGEVVYEVAGLSFDAEGQANCPVPLRVRVWTEKTTYRAGDTIVFRLVGNGDYYARIIDEGPGGDVFQLLPNLFRKDLQFYGGKTYLFPDAKMGDAFVLDVQAPFGQEIVRVFASSKPLGLDRFARYEGDFGVLDVAGETLSNQVKTEIINNLLVDKQGTGIYVTDFVESAWTIETSE